MQVHIKQIVEIDGTQYTIRSADCSESVNQAVSDKLVNPEESKEIIDWVLGE